MNLRTRTPLSVLASGAALSALQHSATATGDAPTVIHTLQEYMPPQEEPSVRRKYNPLMLLGAAAALGGGYYRGGGGIALSGVRFHDITYPERETTRSANETRVAAAAAKRARKAARCKA